jgi:putative SOS response-associated peptidase YedK
LVPATGYYEWKTLANKRKEKYEFTLPGRRLLFMAGVYSESGEFAILTRDAAAEFAGVHERMPVIVARGAVGDWFGGGDVDAVTELEFARV